jgi:hypothetical protein
MGNAALGIIWAMGWRVWAEVPTALPVSPALGVFYSGRIHRGIVSRLTLGFGTRAANRTEKATEKRLFCATFQPSLPAIRRIVVASNRYFFSVFFTY